jgi:hypothetical protein
VRVHDDKGLPIRIDPEPRAVPREGAGESAIQFGKLTPELRGQFNLEDIADAKGATASGQ